MNMKTETVEAVGNASYRVTQGAAAVTGLSWLTSNEFYGFVGALVALGGLWVTWYYKRKADRRMEEEHVACMRREELRLALMRATGDPFAGARHDPVDTDHGKLEDANA